MEEPLVSVITPVYDVEQYINDYLHSITGQTYKNLEIVCVDDKSPDNCADILRTAAERDSRIKIIQHDKNMGYSAAINSGLDRATGDFIAFVDPDDWTETDFFEKSVDLAISSQADVIITNFYREYPDLSEKMTNFKPIPGVFEDPNAAFIYGLESDVYRGFKMVLWNKLFKSKFFIWSKTGGLGLRMVPELLSGTDTLLTAECFLNANKFAYSSQAHYHYRIRENSIMRSKNFFKRLGLAEALERIVQMLENRSLREDAILLAKRFHTYYCSQLAEFAYISGDKENLKLSQSLLMKYLDNYLKLCEKHPDRIIRMKQILSLNL